MAPHWTQPHTMFRTRLVPDPWFANGNADAVHYLGASANEIYRCGVPASGNIVGSVSGTVLSPVLSPHYQQAFTGAAGDPLSVEFDVGTTDSFDAASSAVHNTTTEAMATFVVFERSGASTNLRSLIGKHVYATSGWMVRVSSTNIYSVLFWGTSGISSTSMSSAPALNTPSWLMVWYSPVQDAIGFTSSWDTENTVPFSAYPVGSITTSGVFSLGDSGSRSATPSRIATAIHFSGTAAETVIAARATKLPAWATAAGI